MNRNLGRQWREPDAYGNRQPRWLVGGDSPDMGQRVVEFDSNRTMPEEWAAPDTRVTESGHISENMEKWGGSGHAWQLEDHPHREGYMYADEQADEFAATSVLNAPPSFPTEPLPDDFDINEDGAASKLMQADPSARKWLGIEAPDLNHAPGLHGQDGKVRPWYTAFGYGYGRN